MERTPHAGADGAAVPRAWLRLLAYLSFAGLVAWQGWVALTLFGPDQPWQRLLDDRPVLSGRHPLHLYHGYLGAYSLRERGTLSCYDPAFQAGYPKTPVFDSGSRPAELFLSLGGGSYQPAAYKVGLAVSCLAVPFFLAVAAWGTGLGPAGVNLATLLGLLVWWSTPCRRLLEMGDLDLLLASLSALAQAGLLVRFHAVPAATVWVSLLIVGCLGWFADPLFFAGLLPLILIYYVSVGCKHCPPWHLALAAALLAGLVGNAFWLFDWVQYSWIRIPFQLGMPLLRHRTLHTVWTATLWGESGDRVLMLVLLVLGAAGSWMLNESSQRPAARLLGLGMAGFLALALAGLLWEPLDRVETSRLIVPALWFATLLAVHALGGALRLAIRLTGSELRGALAFAGVLLVGMAAIHEPLTGLAARAAGTTPLEIGLSERQQELLATIVSRTTPQARILWENGPSNVEGSRWTALLPLLTERFYVGGLDLDASIEHSYAGFQEQVLAGRPIAEWSDVDLEAFCRRYHVGWIACSSPASLARFRAWPAAQAEARLPGDEPGWLFRVPAGSFALKGQARLVRADYERIVLADVVPEDGKVVLSLHYQAGLRASPGRVAVEREPDAHDPIPFIRLRVPGPLSRLVLTWPAP